MDKDVDCVCPEPKRRRENASIRDGQIEHRVAIQNYANDDVLGSSLELEDWAAMRDPDLGISLSNMTIPYFPTQNRALDSNNTPSTSPHWFLQEETWEMHHMIEDPVCTTFLELEPFIGEVQEMLQCWISNGHNAFIHRRLYDKGMPTCLQEAFTTLAAYNGCTPSVKAMVLQIAEERLCSLARQSLSTAGGAKGIMDHLAQVQALFVYEFICLFDGSIGRRASAEKEIHTLRRWLAQMWKISSRYRGEVGSLPWAATPFDKEFDASSEIWRLWILTESVRRTYFIADGIANLFDMMVKGWAECAGGIIFSSRRGLWDAESAAKWADLCGAGPPLLVPSLQPGYFISQYSADDFDDIAPMMWKSIVGTDKIAYWISKGTKTHGRNVDTDVGTIAAAAV